MVIRARENLVGAWAFLAGVVIAFLLGLYSVVGSVNPWAFGILALLGVIVGYFVATKDVQIFLIAAVSVVLVSFAGIQGFNIAAAIGGIPIAKSVSFILASLLVLFIPATIIVAMKTVFSIAKS